MDFPDGSVGKEFTRNTEVQVWFLGREDPLEEGIATHSSILAWKIPWTKEPGRLQSMGLQRVRCDKRLNSGTSMNRPYETLKELFIHTEISIIYTGTSTYYSLNNWCYL